MEKFILSQRLDTGYFTQLYSFTYFNFHTVKMETNYAWNDFTVIEW